MDWVDMIQTSEARYQSVARNEFMILPIVELGKRLLVEDSALSFPPRQDFGAAYCDGVGSVHGTKRS